MPNYKDSTYFHERSSSGFDKIYKPGTPTPTSGIYRCESCGFEAVSTAGHPLPPTETCPQHNPTMWPCKHGLVRWKLVAAAIHHKPKKK
jgi:hypothetical protein